MKVFCIKSFYYIVALLFLMLSAFFTAIAGESANWIWAYPDEPAPKNRFTYFRKVVDLKSIPENAELRFAADSNARLWINGQIVRRKVARYNEKYITAEVINAAPYLRVGKNVVVALHHNWGDIITFQRTGNEHAGLYVESSWVKSDESWRCMRAPEFIQHEKQIIGIAGNAPRIRYPLIIDGRKILNGDIHAPSFDDSSWKKAVIVENGPWQENPEDVETPGQREYIVRPMNVLAAGSVVSTWKYSDDPFSMASGIRNAKVQPDNKAKKNAAQIINGKPVTIEGRTGETHYITFDFYRPVHGYPFLELIEAHEGIIIDFGYCEIYRSLYSGEQHVSTDGWINPEGVVGKGYGDRYITRSGPQKVELPDERTARWIAIQIHFSNDAKITISDAGVIKSQYPIEKVGSFSCGSEWIEKIIKLCEIHAEICMSDAYIDTPGREDGQWIEDARLRALIAAHWYNDTKLRELLIRSQAQQQNKDGTLHPFPPSNYPLNSAAYDWSVQWPAVIYDDYMWSGNTEIIKRYWDNLLLYWKNVLSLVDENGIWRTKRVLADIRTGIQCMNDRQSSGVVTPWIIERLQWSADLAEAVGENEQAVSWQVMADKMADAFRKYHIVPAKENIPAHVGDRYDPENPSLERGYSQAAHTIAVFSGLLDESIAKKAVDYAFPEPDGSPPEGVFRWNNPTYCYRALRSLSYVGFTERAVRHLIERYSPYLPGHPDNPTPLELQGPLGGPLPEYWVSRKDLNLKPGEINVPQPIDETGSHGWECVPLQWLHDTILGVKIIEPGGGKIVIAPDDGGLPYISGHVMTPKGLVWVYWNPQQWKLKIKIPDNVEALVILPKKCKGKNVEVIQSASEVNKIETNQFILYSSGEYIFQVR